MSNITFEEIMDFYPEHNQSVFEDLKNDCQKGNLIPFVGAGLSMFCGYLSWPAVLNRLASFVYSKEKQSEIYNQIKQGELLQAAQQIHDSFPRMLVELKKIIDFRKIRDCDETKLQASAVYLLPYLFKSDMVMTTNFDRVLEEVFNKNHAKFENVVDPYELDLLTQLRQKNLHCLFKLHGDISENTIAADKLVFTQKQYDAVYSNDGRLVSELSEWFKNKKLLFLGCSLAMDKTMEVLQSVSDNNYMLDHYAILACQPEDMEARIMEMGNLGISAIYYPSGKYDAVRVILERILEEVDYSAYETLKSTDRNSYTGTTHRFMYNSNFIEFVGRHKEMTSLEAFCQHSDSALWWAVIGPGGMGKSRLVHEFAKKKAAEGWKIFWLKRDDYKHLSDWTPSADNSLVIADDAQAYLQIIGEWICSTIDRPRSQKLRIILLERDGTDLNSASWGEALQEESPYSSPILAKSYRPDFLQLGAMSENDLKEIMANYALAAGKPIKDNDHLDRLLSTLQKVDTNLQRPIYALAIIDAWCSGKDPTRWDKETVLDALVDRELDFYYKRLKNISSQRITKTMKSEFEALLAQSCLNNFIPLNQVIESDYPKLSKLANSSGIEILELIQQVGIVNKVKIHLIEINANGDKTGNELNRAYDAVTLNCPDLIKEYLVLRQAFDRNTLDILLPKNWEDSLRHLSFLRRVFRDYPEKLDGKTKFWDSFWNGNPQKSYSAMILSDLLYGITIQFSSMEDMAIDKLQKIHLQFINNEEIAFQYAHSLFNQMLKKPINEKSQIISKIAEIHQRFSSSTKITDIYARSLLNPSSSQSLDELIISAQKIEKLYIGFNSSKEIAMLYASSLFNLTILQSLEECRISVNKLSMLYVQYESCVEIANLYAKGLANLSSNQSTEESIDTVSEIRTLYEKFNSSEEIAYAYSIGLSKIAADQPTVNCIEIINMLEILHNQFSRNLEIAKKYAASLANSVLSQSLDEYTESVNKLRKLHEEWVGNEDIAAIYAGGFPNLSLKQLTETDIQNTLEQAKELSDLYPQNKRIILCYAMTYFNLTLQQPLERISITVENLRMFLLSHNEINQAFQKELDIYLSEHPDQIQQYQSLRL